MDRTPITHLFRVINRHINGSIGIGAMIVFISMVLVAGIAASILINTSNQLESQALITGHETKTEVSSDIDVTRVIGHLNTRVIDGASYTRFHNMTIEVTPKSGSSINLDMVVIQISNGSKLCALSWDSSKFAPQASGSGVFSTPRLFDLNASDFGIIVVKDGDGSCTSSVPVINQGDKVLLTVNLSACFYGLEQRSEISGMIISEHGSPGIFLFRTPTSTYRYVVKLF